MAITIIEKPKLINFSEDPMYLVLQTDKYTGAETPFSPTHPNLSCYVEVWSHNKVTDTDTLVAKLHVPFNDYTKQATVDLSGLLDLSPSLPGLTATEGQATDVFDFLWVKYADQYGTPVAPETLDEYKNNDKYWSVIKGSARKTIGDFDLIGGFPLNAYNDETGAFFSKTITQTQPEWLYFWLSGTGDQAVTLDITMYFDDNTSEIATSRDITVKGQHVNFISTSYAHMITPLSPAKTVVAYSVILTTPVGLGSAVVSKQKYFIDLATDHDMFVAYFNGLGGIESVRLTGKTSQSYKSTAETFVRAQWGKIQDHIGTIDIINPSGQRHWSSSTGFHSQDYIFHLRQLLTTAVWLINLNKSSYKKLICQTSEIKDIKSTDQNIFSFDLDFTEARTDVYSNEIHQQ